MYQAGVVCQNITCASMCFLSFYVLSKSRIPLFHWYNHPIFLTIAITSTFTVFSVIFHTGDVYCKYYPDRVPDDKRAVLIAFSILYAAPIFLSIVVCFILWVIIRVAFHDKVTLWSVSIRRVVSRILAYAVIYAIGWAPTIILLISNYSGGISDSTVTGLIIFSSLANGSAGIFLCAQHIYFFRNQTEGELELQRMSVITRSTVEKERETELYSDYRDSFPLWQ